MTLGDSILGLFGRSPIKPLQEHMRQSNETAQHLIGFFAAVMTEDWPEGQRLQGLISDSEHTADQLKTQIRAHLPKGLFLPVARADLLSLLTKQDQVANRAKDIAGLMLGRKMTIPPSLQKIFTEYVETCVLVVEKALEAINELDELIETGFGGREVKLLESMIDHLDKLEHKTDEQQIEIRAALFQLEKELAPVDVMFLYKIIEWVGDLANRAENVGTHLEMIIAR